MCDGTVHNLLLISIQIPIHMITNNKNTLHGFEFGCKTSSLNFVTLKFLDFCSLIFFFIYILKTKFHIHYMQMNSSEISRNFARD
jgi:hypothetical protein